MNIKAITTTVIFALATLSGIYIGAYLTKNSTQLKSSMPLFPNQMQADTYEANLAGVRALETRTAGSTKY